MSGRVVIVGGGITGLSAAYRLAKDEDDVEVTVLEADPTPGGKVRSAEVGGLTLEAGPDSLLARKPWAVDLCRELGFGDDLLPSAAVATHIWTERGLLRFPSGPFGISTSPVELWRWKGMSYAGKVRAAGDLVLPRGKAGGDESLGSLLRRRIGNEATDALVAPLLGGLFAGDVDRLSVAATFPELAAWERDHRSLMRGARAMSAARRPAAVGGPGGDAGGGPARPSRPPPMFVRLRGGLRRLTDGLVAELGDRVRTGVAVTGIRADGDGYALATSQDDLEADAVIFASPAFVTAGLVEPLVPAAAPLLRGIEYVSTAVALLVYPEGSGPALPDSSGFVAPRGRLPMNAATVLSKKWPDEAFGSRAVLRCFIGGAGTQDHLDRTDEQIVEDVAGALAGLLPLPPRPESATLVRWPRAMPQYAVGHLERVAAIEAAMLPGLVVAGQAYRGAGLPDCVRQGIEAAERVRARLG